MHTKLLSTVTHSSRATRVERVSESKSKSVSVSICVRVKVESSESSSSSFDRYFDQERGENER